MSTSTQSETPTEQDQERELASKISAIDFAFRDQVKARIEELSKQAGKDALEFLLNPEKVTAEQSALAASARSSAIAEGLHRYISACRNYHDVRGALRTVEGIAECLQTLADFQRAEAEGHALKDLTGAATEVADGRQRKMALSSFHRAEGSTEFVTMLRTAFASVLNQNLSTVLSS